MFKHIIRENSTVSFLPKNSIRNFARKGLFMKSFLRCKSSSHFFSIKNIKTFDKASDVCFMIDKIHRALLIKQEFCVMNCSKTFCIHVHC